MLSSVKLDYYGSTTPLSQLANISTPDAQTLSVQPWEKDKLQDIEKAIQIANLGFKPYEQWGVNYYKHSSFD